MRLKRIFLFIFLFITQSLFCQKVGVVLSGGGAKGLSHIGVLKALEEHNIPIDYIAGTSMGSIIGGLYAAGYSPDEMKEIFMSAEFPTWISGKTDQKYINQSRKISPNPSWLNVNYNFSFKEKLKVNLPTNFIAPTQMDLAFLKIFAGANAKSNGNFDSLFIPFRCVASDVEDNKAYVPAQGDLAQVIRASMTFPFYFKPIRIEGKLLFDGGIFNNFPADIVQEHFNPDFIIGSDVATRDVKLEEDNVFVQLEYMILRKTDYSVGDKGVMIYTENHVENIIDFSNIEGIIQAGYDNALTFIDEIKASVKREENYEDRTERRKAFKSACPYVLIDSIYLEGLNKSQQEYTTRLFTSDIDSLTLEVFEPKYYEFNTDPLIQSTFPTLRHNSQTNLYNMSLDVKKRGSFTSGIGGSISSSPTDQIFIHTNYEYFGKQIYSIYANYYAGSFYTSTLLSARMSIAARLPYYVELFGSYNHWNYFRSNTYFFDDDKPAYLIEEQNYYGGKIVASIKNQNQIGLSFSQVFNTYDYYQYNIFSRTDTADHTTYNPVVGKIFFEHNSLNNERFASKGMKLNVSGKYAYGHSKTTLGNTILLDSAQPGSSSREYQFFSFEVNYEHYFRISPKIGVGLQFDMAYSNKDLLDNYTITLLNANVFNPTQESMTQFMPQFRANQFIAFGVKGVFNLFKNMDFRLEGYIFQPTKTILESGLKPYYSDYFDRQNLAFAAILVYQSFIGPISLSLNYYPEDNNYKHLNFVFTLGMTMFNPKQL